MLAVAVAAAAAAAASLAGLAAAERTSLGPTMTAPALLDESHVALVLDHQDTAGHNAPEIQHPFQDEQRLMRRATPTESDQDASPLPSPFDTLGPHAFQNPGGSDSCPKFMNSLLSDPTFKSCYPVSMLIQTSMGFFNAQKDTASIVKVLDATCAANAAMCTEFLGKAAQNLTSDGNCKSEFQQNQAQVVWAYEGLHAYRILYSAACLRDPASSSYCFAKAVTNVSQPSDSYLYFLPYGRALPGASRPSCSWCVQNTMSIYHDAAADRDQLISTKYEEAARQVDTLCGPDYVNSTLPAAQSAACGLAVPSYLGVMTSSLAAMALFAWSS